MRRRLSGPALAALLVGAAPAAAAAVTVVRPPQTEPGFDARVDQAKAAMMGDPETALHHALEALELARNEAQGPGQSEHLATAEWLQGEALLRLNRLSEAEPAIRAGVADAARSPNLKLRGQLAMAQADVQATQGQVQPALQGFQEAYRIFGQAHEPRGQAMALQDIGSIYQDAGDYAKVLQYYAQSADTYPGDQVLLLTARNNIGNAFKAQGKFAEAEAEFEKALVIARAMKSPLLEVRILTNLASAEVARGRLPEARARLSEAMRLIRDPAAREWEPYIWGVMAQVELKAGAPAQAVADLERAFAGQDLTKTSLLFRDFHEAAWNAYRAVGNDHMALAHLTAFKRLDDEAREVAASTNAALMAAQFDYANQASKIARLKAGELQRDIQLARSRNTISAVLMAGSMIVAVLLAGAFFWIRRSRNQVRAANTELSRANQALESAVQARTEFLATTSHEIRTPLNGILGMTQVLLADPKIGDVVRERVGVIHGAGQTMLAMVSDILDMAKIESGHLVIERAELDLPGLFESTRRLWAEKAEAKGLALEVSAEDAPPRILEDGAALKQVLSNLISNAIKFTDSGKVMLSAATEPGPEGEQLVLRVADTGIGIPEDKREQVFEAFRQVDGGMDRRYGGTGLGLAICRRIAETMGGGIEVESKVGEGSVFTVRLPLMRCEAAAPAKPEHAENAAGMNSAVLLLLDANPMNQSLLRAALQAEAGEIEVTGSLEEAAQTLSVKHVDLVLADGATLARNDDACAARLAKAAGKAHLAVLQAADAVETADALQAAGVGQVLRKPITMAELVEQLRSGYAAGRAAPVARRRRGSAA